MVERREREELESEDREKIKEFLKKYKKIRRGTFEIEFLYDSVSRWSLVLSVFHPSNKIRQDSKKKN